MEFSDILARRYSCRSFSDRPVEREKLERVLEAGRTCPTACNCQPQRVYVAQTPEALEKLAAVTPCTFNAPTILMVCGDDEASCEPRGDWKNYTEIDPCIATSFMLLAATDEGLNTCWVCMFNADEMAAAFELPAHIKPLCLLLLGYAADDAKPGPMHARRNPMDQMVAWL